MEPSDPKGLEGFFFKINKKFFLLDIPVVFFYYIFIMIINL